MSALNIVPLTVDPLPKPGPIGWSWRKLNKIAKLESGHTPSRSRPDWWGGDVPWLALPDIRKLDGQYVDDTIEHTNAEGLANSSARLLPKGTVCLSRTASVGYVTILNRPMATSALSALGIGVS
ncbi:restriction endonuclease subunit S [Rosistilla oblonga]|uniref:restriction endonuclease subunit S n=1 Tax=Rosistilla oblonga TaxID=2527990 RepID=UPI003A985D83